jgi:hypothetical protein
MTGERVKVWTHLGTCLLTGAALSLASSSASAQILKSGSALDSHGSSIVAIAQGGEGGEGGEGGGGSEGGEGGEMGSAASLAEDDVAYLTHLGLVRGTTSTSAWTSTARGRRTPPKPI